MNYDDFLNSYLNQSIDWDKMYGPQCVDEIAQYCSDNNRPMAYANAKDWLGNPALANGFTTTYNNPGDMNQLPSRGDIVIWDGGLPGSGGYGHIAIFDAYLNVDSFQSLDQNWGGRYCHFVIHTWSHVAGWLSPIPEAAPVGNPSPDVHPDPAPSNPTPEIQQPEPVVVPPVAIPLPTGALPITSPRYEHAIIKQIPAYESMTDAFNRANPVDVVSPGVTYYLRTTQNGMDKLSIAPTSTDGVWINPTLNVPEPTPEAKKITTLDEIKKEWNVTASKVDAIAITVAKNLLKPVEHANNADNSWKKMSPFVDFNGKRRPLEYKVHKDYQAHDLEGRTQVTTQLKVGQRILIAGTFKKDGIKYFRPQKVADSGTWWGIPLVDQVGDDVIQPDAPIMFNNSIDPGFILTPQKHINIVEALATGKSFVDRVERAFDIFKGKTKRR